MQKSDIKCIFLLNCIGVIKFETLEEIMQENAENFPYEPWILTSFFWFKCLCKYTYI